MFWSPTMTLWKSLTLEHPKSSVTKVQRCHLPVLWPGWHRKWSEMSLCLKKWTSGECWRKFKMLEEKISYIRSSDVAVVSPYSLNSRVAGHLELCYGSYWPERFPTKTWTPLPLFGVLAATVFTFLSPPPARMASKFSWNKHGEYGSRIPFSSIVVHQ